jgi:hypothetical protein
VSARRDVDSPAARAPVAARTFAVAVVALRALHASLAEGQRALPESVTTVAERLVERVDEHGRLMMALAAAPIAERDRATLGVSATVIALGVARTLTDDRRALTDLAMAGLLHDAGRARLLRGDDGARRLDDETDDRVPASAALALTALGELSASATAPTAIVYEALWLRRQHRLGPLFRGKRPPSVLARVLDVARAFAEQRTAVSGRPTPRIDEAIEALSNRAAGPIERDYVKLLFGALGLFPAGTLVELDTAEVAVVLAAPELPIDFARPRVRVLYDRSGELLATARDLDLAAPRDGGARGPRGPRVVRPLEPDERQRAVARAAMRDARASETPRARPVPSVAPESPRPLATPSVAPESPRVRRAEPLARAALASLGAPPVAPAARAQPYGSRGFGAMDSPDDEPPSYSPIRAPVPSMLPELDDPFHTGRFAADKILAAHHASQAGSDLDGEPVSTRTLEREPAPDFPDPLGPPTIPPPPVLSDRDRLLASFLADEPIDEGAEKPEK